MKPLHLFSALLLLLGTGCFSGYQTSETNDASENLAENAPVDPSQMTQGETSADDLQTIEARIYVMFIQNAHDWVFPENSIATMHRVLDLHEKYQIPLEVHMTDMVVHAYLEQDPALFARLKNSPLTAVSYHLRPPSPVYEGFDYIGLRNMDEETLYQTLKAYEEHRLDVETGNYLPEPGGYQYLKDQLGYAPRIVGHTAEQGIIGQMLSRVYEEKGALFTVIHREDSRISQMVHGLHRRPENTEVKLYEYRLDGFDPEALFKEWTRDWTGESPFFVNLKFHENNFYTRMTPFGPIYWEEWVGENQKEVPLMPPYDTESAENQVLFRSASDQEEKWTIYEESLRYVAEHRDTLTPINSVQLEAFLE